MSSSLILFNNNEPFLDWIVMCNEKWIVYDKQQLAMANSVVGPRRSSKALPKAKLAPKKGHGHCLVVCCQSDPLELSESQRICKVCSANRWDAPKTATHCSWHWSTERAQFSSTAMPDHMAHTLPKLNKLGFKVLPHPPYSTDLLPTNYHHFFAGKMFPQPARRQKMLS